MFLHLIFLECRILKNEFNALEKKDKEFQALSPQLNIFRKIKSNQFF